MQGPPQLAWREPQPSGLPQGYLSSLQALAALFQFLQVWNVSVYHQCQYDWENIQFPQAFWGLVGDTRLRDGSRPHLGPPAPFRIPYVTNPNPGTLSLWVLELHKQMGGSQQEFHRASYLYPRLPAPPSLPFYLAGYGEQWLLLQGAAPPPMPLIRVPPPPTSTCPNPLRLIDLSSVSRWLGFKSPLHHF